MNKNAQGRVDLTKVPPAVKIEGWVNQKMVLAHAHTKVFLTHSGLGSVGEAIVHRVPMLAMPRFGDQPATAKRVEEVGVAERIWHMEHTFAADDIAAKLEKLSSSPEVQANVEKQ